MLGAKLQGGTRSINQRMGGRPEERPTRPRASIGLSLSEGDLLDDLEAVLAPLGDDLEPGAADIFRLAALVGVLDLADLVRDRLRDELEDDRVRAQAEH